MSNLIDSGFVALHSQHTLQHADWLAVYTLAKKEGVGEQLDTYSFEDFLGLIVYLFITTRSQATREQLSQLFSKCGSAVVLPLLKILCQQSTFTARDIPSLARHGLNNMAPYPLAIGLHQVLKLGVQDDLKMVALRTLKQLMQSCQPSVRLVLSQLQLSREEELRFQEISETELLSSTSSDHQRSDDASLHHHVENTASLNFSAVPCV